MLWEMGISCGERSKGIASVCIGPAEEGHHDNVMKAISTDRDVIFSNNT